MACPPGSVSEPRECLHHVRASQPHPCAICGECSKEALCRGFFLPTMYPGSTCSLLHSTAAQVETCDALLSFSVDSQL